MVAYYWETRDGSLARVIIYAVALVVLAATTVLGGTRATLPVLLIGFIGLKGVADEYRRWRRQVSGRRR